MKQTVLITGGSRGIGYATAELLLEKGFRIIIVARDEASLVAARDGFVQAGYSADDIEIVVMDMADSAAIETRIPQCRLLQDGLFGLVNNAAFETLKNLTEYTLDDLEKTWRVNMLAPVLMIRTCHSLLQKAGGSVVNVSSISDREYSRGYSVYGGSKAFINSFSRHACRELGFDGIRINVVSPGGTDTPLMQHMIDIGVFTEEHIEYAKSIVPIEQRFATAREVAETIYFALTGPRQLHGADLRIHGGSE